MIYNLFYQVNIIVKILKFTQRKVNKKLKPANYQKKQKINKIINKLKYFKKIKKMILYLINRVKKN